MSEVWKWKIPRLSTFVLSMPEHARVLHVAGIGSDGYLWALVNPSAPAVERTFIRCVTGMSIDIGPMARHIGTCIEDDGAFVAHIFEQF
jgi:hypothetical protein